jgi:thiol-disulfide isomerase/thioredoxin
MKIGQILPLFLLTAPLIASATTIENPRFKARHASTLNVSAIERTPQLTRVNLRVKLTPKYHCNVSDSTFLVDAASGRKYAATAIHGWRFNSDTVMPESGEFDFTLDFPPLDESVSSVNLVEGVKNSNWKIYGLQLAYESTNALSSLHGNWYATDSKAQWKCGIFDSLLIANNTIYTCESIAKRGNKISLTLRDKFSPTTDAVIATIKSQKNGNMKLKIGSADELTLSPTRPAKAWLEPDNGFGDDFLRTDTTTVRGFIDHYSPELGYSVGLMYNSNTLTGVQEPMSVPINSDGTFTVKVPMYYPTQLSIWLERSNSFSFYAEPGDDITLYANHEEMLGADDARPSEWMGRHASLSYALNAALPLDKGFYRTFYSIYESITPEAFAEMLAPIAESWEAKADSIAAANPESAKFGRIVRNDARLVAAEWLFNFTMYINDKLISGEQPVGVETEDYYNFLRRTPLDDVTILANNNAKIVVNRLYFSNLFKLSSVYTKDDGTYGVRFGWLSDDKRRELLKKVSDMDAPFAWQLAESQNFCHGIETLAKDYDDATEQFNKLKKSVTNADIQAHIQAYIDKKFLNADETYPLPENDAAADIMRQIISENPGKTLFIDFWGTSCGPCIAGIKSSAELRKQYRDSDTFRFIFITGEDESPLDAYNKFVEQNLEGEVSYRLSADQIRLLRTLFNFNAIPHYEMVAPDGTMHSKPVPLHMLKYYLDGTLVSY